MTSRRSVVTSRLDPINIPFQILLYYVQPVLSKPRKSSVSSVTTVTDVHIVMKLLEQNDRDCIARMSCPLSTVLFFTRELSFYRDDRDLLDTSLNSETPGTFNVECAIGCTSMHTTTQSARRHIDSLLHRYIMWQVHMYNIHIPYTRSCDTSLEYMYVCACLQRASFIAMHIMCTTRTTTVFMSENFRIEYKNEWNIDNYSSWLSRNIYHVI